jgi:ribose-phosphate pyrophosphokinase
MMMLLSCDAMMRASAAGVSLVTPFMSYQRQDRKDKPRRPISATLVANMIKATGIVERIITMEMHTDQQQGFYNIPVDNLPYARYFAEHIKARFKNDLGDFVVISPDLGGAVRARRFAKSLGDLPIAIGEKQRTDENPSSPEVLSLTGSPHTSVHLPHQQHGYIHDLWSLSCSPFLFYARACFAPVLSAITTLVPT